MVHFYTLLALDIARERAQEAADRRRVVDSLAPSDRVGGIRRALAAALGAISRGSAAAAHRLDDDQADARGRPFATAR